jgi:hypothetical protein
MRLIYGEVARLRLSVLPFDGVAVKDSEWVLCFAVNDKQVQISDGVYASSNEVEVILDTRKLEVGKLSIELTVKVPDSLAPDGYRIGKREMSGSNDRIDYGLLAE